MYWHKDINMDELVIGVSEVGAVSAVVSGGITAASMLLDDTQYVLDEIMEETAKSSCVGAAAGTAGLLGGELLAGAVGIAGAPDVAVLAVGVAGTVAVAGLVDSVAKPTVDGIVDAVKYDAPEMAFVGLQDGVENAAGRFNESVENISEGIDSVVSNVVDFVSDVGDSISSFCSELFA